MDLSGWKGWKPSPLFVAITTAAVLLLFVFIVLQWNRQLKRQVLERTVDLETEFGERIQAEREKEVLQLQVHRAKKMEAVGLLAEELLMT